MSWALYARGLDNAQFHGQLPNLEKKNILKRWIEEWIRVIVATQAFGMGINMPEVRYVIHYNFSSSLLAYVQEIGRAGRDREDSFCYLYFNMADYYT